MPGVLAWGYYPTDKIWLPIQVDSSGRIKADMSAINLDDLADVSVPAPGDDYFIYWDAATSLWKCRALVDADIPAAICRDSELSDHAALPDVHHATHLKTLADHPLSIIPTMDDDHIPTSIARDAELAGAIITHEGDASAHHARYTDAEAKAAAVLAGAITDGETKAPTHDAVFDVKTTADAAQTAAEVAAAIDTDIATHTALPSAHHVKYTDAEAKAAAVLAGAITDGETKAPTHDAVYDVKVTAEAAQTEAEVDAIADALIATHTSDADAHHPEEIAHGRAKYNVTQALSIPGVDFISVTTSSAAADTIYYSPMKVDTPVTIDQLVIGVIIAAAGGKKARMGIYNANINWQPTSLVVDGGEVAIDAGGVVTAAVNVSLQEGRYLLAYTANGTPTLRALMASTGLMGLVPTLVTAAIIGAASVAKAYAALADPGTAWDTAGGSNISFCHRVFVRVATP